MSPASTETLSSPLHSQTEDSVGAPCPSPLWVSGSSLSSLAPSAQVAELPSEALSGDTATLRRVPSACPRLCQVSLPELELVSIRGLTAGGTDPGSARGRVSPLLCSSRDSPSRRGRVDRHPRPRASRDTSLLVTVFILSFPALQREPASTCSSLRAGTVL